MRKTLLLVALLAVSCGTARQAADTYFTIDEMPDLVKCLPAPPEPGSAGFAYDSTRYEWGKLQRLDPERAALADHDAIWTLPDLFTTFNEPFGMELSPEGTPQIWKLLEESINTVSLIRIRPKAHFHRIRPFEYFNEPLLTTWEEAEVRGEGSYPSGHTIRSWAVAMILAEINPDAAEALYARGWIYGDSRVIVGAHWQSDVDNSRVAAAIGYAHLQSSPAFRAQMERAKKEFRRLQRRR